MRKLRVFESISIDGCFTDSSGERGVGRTVFSNACKLRLLQHRAFRCGNAVVSYAR